MQTNILIGLGVYLVIVIFGFGAIIGHRQKKKALKAGSFILSDRDLPMPVVACTLALTVLGTIHVLGLFEMSFGVGAVAQWVSYAHVVLLIVVCLVTGRFARQLQVSSIPELISMLFGPTARLMVACVMAGGVFGIMTLEVQGFGIILNAVTGWNITAGSIVGAIFGVLYVIFAGMKEIGWVNLINTILMYTGLIVAAVAMNMSLEGGWDGVQAFYLASDTPWKLSVMGDPGGVLFASFALAFVFSTTFFQGCSQMALQPALSAKDEKTVKRAMWLAAPLNGLFGVFTIGIGMAAFTWYSGGASALPMFQGMPPEIVAKVAAPNMIVQILPTWVVIWLLASFVAAVLSTFAMISMSVATIFTLDIYKNLYNPSLTPTGERRMVRTLIVIVAIYATVVAQFLPELVRGLNWLFAWLSPVFVLIIAGLFWKRSEKAAIVTLAASWIVNCLWSFTPIPNMLATTGIAWLDPAIMNNVYPCVIVSIIFTIVTHSIYPCKPKLLVHGAATRIENITA